jgi:hypothetical protein
MIATETPPESAPPGRSPRQRLAAFGLWLSQPATPLPEQARLLSGLLLALILLSVVGISALYLTLATSNPLPEQYLPVTVLGTALLVAAYWLNRRGRYHLATGLTIGVSALGVWVVVIAKRTSARSNLSRSIPATSPTSQPR